MSEVIYNSIINNLILKEISFQIKRKELKNNFKADFAITLIKLKKGKIENRIRTADWLLEIIKDQPNTRQWLDNSLKWLLTGTQYDSIFNLLE
ncbi:MAG: hypothetical protein ACFFDF_10370 [Candidatus Odinarchaeota archaeon]